MKKAVCNVLILAGCCGWFSVLAADDDCHKIKENDARLACFDSKAPNDHSMSGGAEGKTDNPVHVAIDRHLSSSLLDPLSAINYSVSDAASCDQLIAFKGGPSMADKHCACYRINSKNRMGGYVGEKLGVVILLEIKDDLYMAMSTRLDADVKGCFEANLSERSASKIADHVKK